MREHHGLVGRKVVLCVSRLVTRKGQDTLIRALPRIRHTVPDAALLIVGQGPDQERLRKLADRYGDGHVVFAGGLDHASTTAYYAAADAFAMPCRTRKAGLEAEGLGIVFLEAAASGLPVVVGDSGARRTRCWTGRRARSSTAATRSPSRTPSRGSSSIRCGPPPWGRPGGTGWRTTGPGTGRRTASTSC